MKTIDVTPLQDCLIVEQAVEPQKGLIILPTEKICQGTVVAVGPGKGTIPMDVSVGDYVLFSQHAGLEFPHNGEKFLAMRINDVIGIFNGN